MHKFFAVLVFLGVSLFVFTRPGQGGDQPKGEPKKPDPKKVKELMHRKLEYSQKVLEALATNDLDKAAKSAAELIRIRKEAAFKIVKTKEYEIWANDFNDSAKAIVQAAKDKNLEAAKLSYLGMTLACFHCHTYVRDLGRIRFEGVDQSTLLTH